MLKFVPKLDLLLDHELVSNLGYLSPDIPDFHVDGDWVALCFDFDCLLWDICLLHQKWSQVSHASNVKLNWCTFSHMGRSFVFILKMPDNISQKTLCLKILLHNLLLQLFSFYNVCGLAALLLSTVICNEGSAFYNSTVLPVISSTVCICSMFWCL